VGMICPLDPRN